MRASTNVPWRHWSALPIVLLVVFTASMPSGASQRPEQRAAGTWVRTQHGVIVTPARGSAKSIRIDVMNDRIIHVTAVPTSTFETPKSLMAVMTPRSGVKFSVTQSGNMLALKAPRASADISLITGEINFRDASGRTVLSAVGAGTFTPVKVEGKDFYAVQQEFNRGTDEGFYGLGQHQNGQYNYNGEDVDLAHHNMDTGIPLVVSSRNYGVLWDNNSITRFGDPREYRPISTELTVTDADGKRGGLTARYSVSGQLRVTRVEDDVNYQYIKDMARWPAALMNLRGNSANITKNQTVTWEGRIESGKTGVHKFRLYVSSYVKVYVDGKLIMDAWRQNWNPWYRNFDLPMRANVSRAIRIEWIPNDGYIRLLHADPLPAAQRHSLSLSSDVAKSIDYYYIGGTSYDDVISGYRQVTGKSLLMPRWAMGFWQSRDHYETQQQLLETVHTYRAQRLPLDNIVQDWRYWPDSAWGSHEFETSRFPDPGQMVKDVHDANAHIMISVWPKFYPSTANYKELDAVGGVYHGNIGDGAKDWVGPGYPSTYYDPYNARASDIYWRQVQSKLGVLGFDAWWLDNDEPDIRSNLDIDTRQRIMGPTALGPGAEYFNTFPLVHVGAVYDRLHALHPDTRQFLFTRSGYAGIQRYSTALWSGDLPARWEDLHNQVTAGLGMSMAGVPIWTFDIGAYVVEDRFLKPDAANLAEWRELYLRWFQFGAFAPIFRSHGQGQLREIYNISPPGTPVYDALAWYDRLRYRLMPYIYTQAGKVYHDDYTMMRGLVMDFPNDRAVASIGDEYMFGPAFLVAPVSEYQARSRSVYLPAGTRWYDFYSGRMLDGGQRITAAAPLDRMPLFVKAGSIVPTGPDIQYTNEKPAAPLTLFVYTGANGKAEIYTDDGVSYRYQKGEFARVPLSYDDASGTLTIGARQGRYPGMIERAVFSIRWISGPTKDAATFDIPADTRVTYTGAALTVRRR